MYVEKDYILRLIHEIVRMLIRLLTGKDIEEDNMDFSLENEGSYNKLIRMVDDGDINSAENISDIYGYGNVIEMLTKEDD